jgi:hypothetical protein
MSFGVMSQSSKSNPTPAFILMIDWLQKRTQASAGEVQSKANSVSDGLSIKI